MLRPIKVARTRQPSGPVPLDAAHPLYSKIAGVIVPAWGIEAKSGVRATPSSTSITDGSGVEGRCRKFTTATVYDQFSGEWSRVPAGNGFSLLSVYRITDLAASVGRVSGNFQSTVSGYGFLPNATSGYRFGVSRAGVNTIIGATPLNAGVKCDIGVVDATNVRLYENGSLTAGPTAHGGVTTATGNFRLGADSGGTTGIAHEHYLTILFNAPLSADEVELVTQNPWQVFEPEIVFKSATIIGGTASISTAWQIEANVVRDLAYAVFGGTSCTVAWDLLNQVQHDAAWCVQSSVQADTDWRITRVVSNDSAWQILASGAASVDVAWRVINTLQQATAARLLAQAQRDSGWAVLNQLSLDSGWAMLNAQQQQLLWRILAGGQVDTGWDVLNAISSASSWRVLAQHLIDAGWKISASAALDTAWAVDGIEAVSVESMVFRAGARTLVVDAKARTITFIQ